MKRALTAVLLTILLIAGAGAFLWYFAYGTDQPPPTETHLAALSSPATIHWQKQDVARIEGTTPSDAAAALGYVHGTQRTWSLALWRQTALGQLSAWFGRGLFPLDRHARQLGLGSLARDAYAQLPDSTQHLLTAYAEGVNAAFQDGAAQRHDELVLLDLSPAPWEPWHALAIERLIAWLATAPLPDSAIAAADSSTARFFDTDAQFRRWLHLHGFDRSVAWAVQEDEGSRLFQRHVFGTSALPLLQEVVIDRGETEIAGASLPGTPFFPAGQSETHAWSLLLSSPLELTFAPVDSSTLATDYEQIRFHDGGEVLLTVRRTPHTLPLGRPDPRPISVESLALPDTLSPADSIAIVDSVRTRRRSVWQVQWPGFEPVTDAAAWQTLTTASEPPPFQLADGRGLRVSSDGTLRVLGTPPVVERAEDGVLVGQDDWARMQAHSLRARRSTAFPLSLADLSANDSSTWAAQRLTELMSLLRMAEPSAERLRESMTYLRNWNHTYDRASIGASIFDAWMRAHRAETDSLPQAPNHDRLSPPEDSVAYVQWADSLRTDSLEHAHMLHRTLQRAGQSLTEDFGPDFRRWRWERVNTSRRYFPVWSADSLIDGELYDLSSTRYAPLERPGRGHPSALAGGTTLLDASPPAAAAWEGWTSTAAPARFMVRRFHPRTDAFLGRHAAPDRRPAPFPLRSNDDPVSTTVLRPAQP